MIEIPMKIDGNNVYFDGGFFLDPKDEFEIIEGSVIITKEDGYYDIVPNPICKLYFPKYDLYYNLTSKHKKRYYRIHRLNLLQYNAVDNFFSEKLFENDLYVCYLSKDKFSYIIYNKHGDLHFIVSLNNIFTDNFTRLNSKYIKLSNNKHSEVEK